MNLSCVSSMNPHSGKGCASYPWTLQSCQSLNHNDRPPHSMNEEVWADQAGQAAHFHHLHALQLLVQVLSHTSHPPGFVSPRVSNRMVVAVLLEEWVGGTSVQGPQQHQCAEWHWAKVEAG